MPLPQNTNPPRPHAKKSGRKQRPGAARATLAAVTQAARHPMIAHLLRAVERFNDRMGNQFGAAITYFSFLSLIPLMMVAFAVAGYVLASHPTLLEYIFTRILNNVSDPTLAGTLKSTLSTAVQQRTTVGLIGLLIALYSGINWMGNLREAVSEQFRESPIRHPQDREKMWVKYLRDFIALTGMLMALIISLSITSVSGSA